MLQCYHLPHLTTVHKYIVFGCHIYAQQFCIFIASDHETMAEGTTYHNGEQMLRREKTTVFSVFYKFDVLVCVPLQFVRCTIARTLALAVLQPLQRFICM